MEKTLRNNGKWAKISGQRGKWTVAKGWTGNFKASKVQTWPTKAGAMIAAQYWISE